MPKTKKGNWSRAEKAFVRDHATDMSVAEMAARLNRDPDTLRAWMKSHPKEWQPEQEEKEGILASFRSSLAWHKLKDEFSDDELAYFEEEYSELLQQFQRDEVLKTEEQQIRKAITLDILMRRNMAARKKLLADIARMEGWQRQKAEEYRRDKDTLSEDERQRAEDFLLKLETELSGLRAAEQGKTREFADLDNRHQKLMEALKATREQRISRVEGGKQSWLGVLKELAEEQQSEQEGRLMEMMREASDREMKRLAKPHVFADNVVDQPVLTPETVDLADDGEDDEGAEGGPAAAGLG